MIEVLSPPPAAIDLAAAFRALGDPTRLAIVAALADGRRCVCDIQSALDGVSPSLLSHHLRVLREAGLVAAERRGRWIDYWLDPTAIAFLRAALPPAPVGPFTPPAHCCEP